MADHTNEQFTRIVDILNLTFKDKMTFKLVGSLAEKPASYHDADIVVYPHPALPTGIKLEGFIKACKKSGAEIIKVDTDSTEPFPGRPDGQDRIRLRFTTGQVADLFFPKGKKK
jgi:hypothetical protein